MAVVINEMQVESEPPAPAAQPASETRAQTQGIDPSELAQHVDELEARARRVWAH